MKPSKKSKAREAPDTSTSLVLGNGLQVLSLIAKSNGELSVREIAQALQLSSTVSHRLIATLKKFNFIEKNSNSGKYRIGVECFLVGQSYSGKISLEVQAKPILQQASIETGANCYLGVRSDNNIVYLAAITGSGVTKLNIAPGTQIPLHLTAMGLSILAQLSDDEVKQFVDRATQHHQIPISEFDSGFMSTLVETRTSGFSLHHSRIFPGTTTLGCALKSETGETLGAISFGSPTNDLTQDRIDKLSSTVRKTAQKIEGSIQATSY